ncbi:hypothetical protein B0H14DRAFT_2581748 [Mycena olivaceomarginata]|nr:hypothetical protein B0H14DRAFT_2581748 [Mycena olivaceomarginata]
MYSTFSGHNLQKMLNDESAFASTMVLKGKVVQFLDEAPKIQDVRYKLRQLVNGTEEHDLVSRQKEIEKRTAKIQIRITAWRKMQNQLMPYRDFAGTIGTR